MRGNHTPQNAEPVLLRDAITDLTEELGLRRVDAALRDLDTEDDITRLARATGVYRDGSN